MRKITSVIYLLAISFVIPAMAQAPQRRDARTAQNAVELEQIFKENFELDQNVAMQRSKDFPARMVHSNGVISELHGLSAAGYPLYYQTSNNLDAAKTISTNKVWPGGSTGTSLTGQNMTGKLAVWDGAAVLTSHQEFGGRVTVADGTSSTAEHATHVAGTMVASGIMANAKGMSYQAPLKSYDWNNDASEMSTAAAAGLLVSNHSYGSICGWNYNTSFGRWEWYGETSISSTEDYKFGFYDQTAADWDQIAFQSPNYLIVKAAGNDRGEVASGSTWYVRDQSFNWVQGSGTKPPADGAYDCITTNGVAKNILTIGAVNAIPAGYSSPSGVVMSSFSGWGPTDDGRIKPDVVADGVNVYSCSNTSTTGYATLSGTSMATPNASGSALLIQQHYNNLKNKYMRSASLKGLIIHTADEAGTSTGPDYTFGWGLMNTAKAVALLSDTNANQLVEATLITGNTYNYSFTSTGNSPIRVTVAWTDRAGSPPSASLDPADKMLVNDLDLRLVRLSDNQTFFPYILNPSTPSAAATTGDNFRDNVEQVYIAAPQAGSYKIVVSHKQTIIGGSQSFSLILSGRTPIPGAAFTVSSRTACTGTPITFTDQSIVTSSRVWYFPGGSPSTSTATNPSVTYNTPGTYPVALKAVNLAGTDSIYKEGYILVGGLNAPIMEDFEANSPLLNLWSIENPDNDSLTWRLWTVAGTSPGTRAMGINNFDGSVLNRVDRLVSPVFNLIGMQSASLSFKHAYTRYASPETDSLIVSVSANCGQTWTRVITAGESGSGTLATAPNSTFAMTSKFTPTSAAQWCGGGTGASCFSVDLSPYLGKPNLKIRFENKAGWGNNLFLDNINITGVLYPPVAGFYVANTTVCSGIPLKFTDTSKNVPSNWLWTFSGANISSSTAQNPMVVYPAAGTYKVSLKVVNASGADSIVKDNYITVVASPAAPVLSASHALNLCNGDSVTFTASGAVNYQWYKDSALLNGASAPLFTVKDSGTYFVRTADGSTGCYSQSPVQKVSTGTYPAVPSVTKNISSGLFCDGTSFTLTSSSTINNQWQRNGTDMAGQNSQTLNYNDSGSFTVKVTNSGCSSVSVPLALGKLPKPLTSEIKGSVFAYRNSSAIYTVTPGIAGSTFSWVVYGGTIASGSGSNQVTINWGSGSNASIEVTENGPTPSNCNGDKKVMVVQLINTGIEDASAFTGMKVYPNPAANTLHVDFTISGDRNTELSVLNMVGQEVLRGSIHERGPVKHNVDISKLPAGMYMLQLSSGTDHARNLFIKE